jgi:hypothetical protein
VRRDEVNGESEHDLIDARALATVVASLLRRRACARSAALRSNHKHDFHAPSNKSTSVKFLPLASKRPLHPRVCIGYIQALTRGPIYTPGPHQRLGSCTDCPLAMLETVVPEELRHGACARSASRRADHEEDAHPPSNKSPTIASASSAGDIILRLRVASE